MKKLLVGAAIVLGTIHSIKAQTTILSQPFGTATIPTGWSQNTPAVPANNWKFTNAWGAQLAGAGFTMQGYCACIDDPDNNPGLVACWDTLKSPVMNCSTYSSVLVSLNYWYLDGNGYEDASILVSTNSGATWTQAIALANTGNYTNYWANGIICDISAYAAGNANVEIAFAYYNGRATSTSIYDATGLCVQDVDVYAPSNYDVKVASQNGAYYIQTGAPYTFIGSDSNYGATAITSMNMNYSVDGAAAVSQTISGISGFNTFANYNWAMNSVPFTPPSSGLYHVKFWANNLNGSNVNTNTDTLAATFLAIDSVQTKQVMFEEFMQASCDPCLWATPNLDAVMRQVTNATNTGVCNIVRNHVDWPGTDYMNDETQAPFVNARVTYYNVSAAPDAKIDGSTDVDPASITVAQIQQEHNIGSPFKINITSATYDPSTNLYSASVDIKAYTAFAAGLTAQAVLTVDTIDYAADQSTEDPVSEFAPPIGSTTVANGGDPDSMYNYVVHFPNVAEDMMPSSSGSTLGAFTAEQTQTLTLSWTKNHPWGSSPQTYTYDSTYPGTHLTVFIQTNSAIAAENAPATYIFQSAAHAFSMPTGVQEIANGVYFQMYPNPANNNAILAFKLDNSQNVNVEVVNMLGEKVYSDNEGFMSTGTHNIIINSSALQTGVYFVRFITDNGSTTKKLIIQH